MLIYSNEKFIKRGRINKIQMKSVQEIKDEYSYIFEEIEQQVSEDTIQDIVELIRDKERVYNISGKLFKENQQLTCDVEDLHTEEVKGLYQLYKRELESRGIL